MTQDEKDGIEGAINPLTMDDAIHLVNVWTLSRILEWDEDLIPFLLQTMISKIGAFDVDIPDVWYNILLNPSMLSNLKDNDMEYEYIDIISDNWRPTAESETLFNSDYI